MPADCSFGFFELIYLPSIWISTGVAGLVLIYGIFKYVQRQNEKQMYEKFKTSTNDTVILHAFPKIDFPSGIPSCQPWVLKIELFCKMAKVPYEIDYEYPFGPNGKSPWITLNGQHKGDSQLIVEFLQKRFDFSGDGTYSEGALAVARAVRVMLEERFYWSMILWRWVWPEGKALFYRDWCCLDLPSYVPLWLLRLKFNRIFIQQTWNHGIGRHPKGDIRDMFLGDLRTVSKILANKKYILGDTICAEDCSIFGFVAEATYGMPDSPYEKIIQEELPNLKNYVDRIRKEYFPEWRN